MSKKTKTENKSVVRRCTCHHDYQDYLYGKGMRVHNSNQKGDEFTCTVCGKVTR